MTRGRAYGSRIEVKPKRQRRRPELGTARWKRLRKLVLVRDLYTCHWCGGVADQGDHLLPDSHGGAAYDPENVVASCGKCNSARPPVGAYPRAQVHKRTAYSASRPALSEEEGLLDAPLRSLSPQNDEFGSHPPSSVRISQQAAPIRANIAEPIVTAVPTISGDYSAPLHKRVHKLRVR